ncbi:MAG: TonB-dependent receptor plug domain-containing protein [Bacteroidales bacterium]|nr:TonB-dependent receptor plug domain-containing protein [Bacteroidales bacterium]
MKSYTRAFSATILVLLLAIAIPVFSYAQEEDTLSTVVISRTVKQNASRNAKFNPGTRYQKFEEISQVSASNSLSDFIKQQTAIYIKEYGRGMSSYISMRGTSSSHTTIDWNGQSLAIPTMGQTDLSHVPLYFFDNMTLHLGGNSALYGNGSLSGNIQLNTTPLFNDGISGDITLKGGSFATLFSGATLRYSKNGWESRTSAYWTYAKNNFKFRNNTEIEKPIERLNNAQYCNWGALQEVFRKFKDKSLLQMSVMYLDFNRNIQPSVSNNMNELSYHSILDRNLKASIAYSGNRESWHYNVRTSYCHDYELYEKDIIEADRVTANGDIEYRYKRFNIKGGAAVEYIKPNVEAYKAGTKEWRGDIFALMLWTPFQPLTVGAGIRGSFVTDMRIPVQPSLNLKYQIVDPYSKSTKDALHNLSARASFSKNAKIPTLNDRYWGGTTANLNAETGTTYEIGADYSLIYRSWEAKGFVTAYISQVYDWIRWLPTGEIWRPSNVPEVCSKGIECGLGIIKKWNGWKMFLDANYAFTDVTVEKSLLANDPSVGHQMAYQPKHTATVNLGANINRLTANITYNYAGERTSTDIYDIMPAYSLLDFAINYKFPFLSKEWGITGEIKNIFNTDYQNVRFYAMPGTNFALAVQLIF